MTGHSNNAETAKQRRARRALERQLDYQRAKSVKARGREADYVESMRQRSARVLAPGGLLYFTVNFHHSVYSAAARLHSAWNAAGLGFEVGPFADHTVHLTLDAARALFDGLPLRVLDEHGNVADAKRAARLR